MRRAAAALLAAGIVALGACGDDPVAVVEFQVIEEVAFDSSLGIDLADYTEQPSGVWIRDLTVGTGTVLAPGSVMVVTYTGWLTNGTAFDSGTLDQPYLTDPLIEGFEMGLEGMAQGGTRRMIIPPGLAYGGQSRGVIPPGSILIFEVGLTSVTAP